MSRDAFNLKTVVDNSDKGKDHPAHPMNAKTRRASLEPTRKTSFDASSFQASRQVSFQGRHSKSFESAMTGPASFQTAMHNCSKQMGHSSLEPQILSALPRRRRASFLVMGNSSGEISLDQKLQSTYKDYIRSQRRLSLKYTANQSIAVVPDSKPVPLLLDGRFADLARHSNVAAALTVRALMIKGVSRFIIAESGLSLKANKVNWDDLKVDRQMKHLKERRSLLHQKRHSLP